MFQHPAPANHSSSQFGSPHASAVVRERSTYMSDIDAQQFCIFFAEGLDSGLGYARVISFLERKGVKASVVHHLRRALLEQGQGLSEAFTRFGLLDASARRLVQVAESQGTLPELLRMQSHIYRDRYERKKDVALGAIEPMVMGVLAFGGVMPIFSNIMTLFESTNSVASDALRIMAGPLLACLFVFALYLLGAYIWLSLPVDLAARDRAQRLMLSLPLISHSGRLFATSLFCRYFYCAVRSGMNMFDSIKMAAEACNDPRLASSIHTAQDLLQQGHSLEQSLAAVKPLSRDVVDYVGMGEETGRLEEMLQQCAEIFKERAEKASERAVKVVIYIFRLGVFVGVMAIAFVGLFDRFSDLLVLLDQL